MFDPDNFYEILRCKYSWPRTPNLLLSFDHGSKNFGQLRTLVATNDSIYTRLGDYAALGKIVFHDQEPFSFFDAAYTYRQFLKYEMFQEEYKTDPKIQKVLDHRSSASLLTMRICSGMQSIFCHSELNSPDIKLITENCNVIECYYWYHAMISRDWFRHWQYHPDVLPRDRGAAPYRFMLYARGKDGTRFYRQKFLELMQPYRNQLFCGQSSMAITSSDYSAKIDVQDANAGAIHIVLETLFETPKIHLTEKIFKPMVMSQPFFLFAGPGALKYLRDYGFQTFGNFWDESYDLIIDHDERMVRIIKEIEKILLLSQTEFQNLYRSMIPVIIHNRQRFFSSEFQEYCVREMENNFQSALDLQQKNINIYPGGTWAQLVAEMTKENETFMSPGWPENMINFLNSEYLQVPKEKIIEKYPILSKYVD